MNIYLFHRDEWEKLYNNCSSIDANPLPWHERRYFALSCIITALCVFYSMLYVPCIFSLKRHLRDERGRTNPCFVILVYISVVDLVCIWAAGFVHGLLYLLGAVYCTYPAVSFWTGVVGTNFAHAEILADVVLAMNRCLDILSPNLASALFRGNRVWLWLLPCTAFGAFTFAHEMPLVFNGLFFGWFTNPYEGFVTVPADTYKSYWCVFACLVLVFGTSLIYALFLIAFYIKYRLAATTVHKESLSKMRKSIFLQVFLISLFNVLTGGIFFLMNQFPSFVTPTTIIIGHFAWFHIHGIPPVIYICLNKTLRKDCRKVLGKLFNIAKWHNGSTATMLGRSSTLVANQPASAMPNPVTILPASKTAVGQLRKNAVAPIGVVPQEGGQ